MSAGPEDGGTKKGSTGDGQAGWGPRMKLGQRLARWTLQRLQPTRVVTITKALTASEVRNKSHYTLGSRKYGRDQRSGFHEILGSEHLKRVS